MTNTTTGAFAGAGAGILAAYIVIRYFDGWDESDSSERVFAAIAGLAAFNVVARGVGG